MKKQIITIKVTNKSLQRLKQLAIEEKSETARWLATKISAEAVKSTPIAGAEPSKPDFRTIAKCE